MGLVPAPVTPIPLVSDVKFPSDEELILIGENFTPDLTVWFGDIEAETKYR